MIQPPYLQQGDTIGLVCPSGAIPIEKVQNCIQTIEKWGYRVQLGATVGSKKASFSASDEERRADLQAMLDNKNIKAILCARGGYGLSRIINELNFLHFNAHPKWIVGFSDITVLHASLQKQNCSSIHGPMSAAFNKGEAGAIYIQSLRDCLEGKGTKYDFVNHPFNKMGLVKAPILGGNLCMIAHLVGSKNALDSTGKIIFIEEVAEHHYNIDRLMIQCVNAGLFEKCQGLIVGGFTDLKDSAADFGATAYEIIASHTAHLKIPISFNFPISHGLENIAIKQGQIYSFEVNEEGGNLKEA
jgi:muramoyltetrapeptide carboxypeptidase